jgi:general secretion pathway protein H
MSPSVIMFPRAQRGSATRSERGGSTRFPRAQRGFATRSERRGARGPSQGPRVDDASGFTLIELIIVVAIVGLIMSLGVSGLRSLARSDLRASATNLAGAMRFLFDRASTTGKTHRLVLDIDAGRYWAEVSDDKFYAPREVETIDATRKREAAEMQEDDERRQAEEKAAAAASSSLSTSTLPTDSSYDPNKLDVGEFHPKHARFAAFKDLALKPVKLKKGIVIRSVYTPRVTDAVTSGRAYVYFFPLGQTEPAIVSLSNAAGDTVFSLVAHPITGRVHVYNQEVKPPVGPASDDEGNQVTP